VLRLVRRSCPGAPSRGTLPVIRSPKDRKPGHLRRL
jgi:hypothetical protein